MKKYLLISLATVILPIVVFAYTSPGKPQGFVSDFAGILSTSDVASLNSKLSALKDSTSVEIAIVTVPTIGDETIETYAVKLFEEWGIGVKGQDNGLLILVAPNDRVARIETGYGMEGIIPDIIANNIIQNEMLPSFRAGNYPEGITKATDAVIGIINKTVDPSIYSNSKTKSNSGIGFEAIIFFVFLVINVFGHALSKTKSWWLGGVIGAVIGVIVSLFVGFLFYGLGAIIILAIAGLIFDFIVSKIGPKGPGGHGGFWIGGSGHGGGGGGFGGFGGGMSGGGGASGRW